MKETVQNLKDRPKEDRVAVAGGMAIMVMVLILVVWGYIFLQKLAHGEPIETNWGPREDVVDLSGLKEATEQFNKTYNNTQDELRQIRDTAARVELDRLQVKSTSGNQESSDVFLDTRPTDTSGDSSFGGGSSGDYF